MEFTLPVGGEAGPVMKGGHWADELHPEYALTFEGYEVDRKHKDSGSGFRCVRRAE